MLYPASRRALRSRIRVLSLTLLATLAACGGGGNGDDDRAESRRTLTVGTTSLMAGQTTTATLRDLEGTIVDPATVQWTSSDETVATVSANGSVITSGAGTAAIVADVAGERSVADLTVSAPPTNIVYTVVELSPPVFSEAAGGDVAVIVDALPGAAAVSLQPSVDFPEPPADAIPFRRLGDASRFVAVLSEPDVRAALQRSRSSVRCDLATQVCKHDPSLDDSFTLGSLTITDAAGAVLFQDPALLTMPVVASNEAPVAVTALAPDVQRSAYVVNVRLDDVRQNGITAAVTRTFYRHFDDVYDYLALVETAAPRTTPYFESLRSRVSGIGKDLYDLSVDYGGSAAGRVLGIVNYGNNTFDLGHIVLVHEMGHAFMNFLRQTPFASGIPHWPLSTAAFGVLGSTATKLTLLDDGTYRVDRQEPYGGLNDLELYLFGLADPSEVAEQIVFDPQPYTIGSILHGRYTRVTIDDLIATYGPREPAWDGAPVTFRLASLVVSRGRLLTPLEMTYFERGARNGEATERANDEYDVPFAVATRGRGVLITKLD